MGRPFNPLSLAVIALLQERPMHPYEIAFTMRNRRMEESIKLNFGSLYHIVDTLQCSGLIAPAEIEHALIMRQAELDWLRRLVQEIESGNLEWRAGLRRPAEEER